MAKQFDVALLTVIISAVNYPDTLINLIPLDIVLDVPNLVTFPLPVLTHLARLPDESLQAMCRPGPCAKCGCRMEPSYDASGLLLFYAVCPLAMQRRFCSLIASPNSWLIFRQLILAYVVLVITTTMTWSNRFSPRISRERIYGPPIFSSHARAYGGHLLLSGSYTFMAPRCIDLIAALRSTLVIWSDAMLENSFGALGFIACDPDDGTYYYLQSSSDILLSRAASCRVGQSFITLTTELHGWRDQRLPPQERLCHASHDCAPVVRSSKHCPMVRLCCLEG